jgi:tRNA(Ile)-lysidine synthase
MPLTDLDHPLLRGMRSSGLIQPGQRVLAAVSGGPDSTALLGALLEEGHVVVAAHYDHALRTGSELAAGHVAQLCALLGVELIVERRESPMPRGSMQAAARKIRNEFLERAREKSGAQVVALGHTADDLVEGVLLHLMRGCGLAGLRGMPARRGAFVRPMLSVWRREVLDFLARRGVMALDDPANADTRFQRVKVRRDILPALERDRPGISKRFHAVAMRAAAMQDAVASAADARLDGPALSQSQVAGAAAPLAAELMKQLYTRAGGDQPALSRRHLQSMIRLAAPGRGGRGVDLPGGFRFRVVGGRMEVVAPSLRARRNTGSSSLRLEVTRCEGCEDRGAAHLKSDLALRLGFRTPGLRMRPLGGRGTRKLQDLFVDARVPREERDAYPLVFAGDRLAWVPGVAVDAELASRPREAAFHVTVTRILPGTDPMLESPNTPPGNPS